MLRTRRAFLTGRFRAPQPSFRPPWAQPGGVFEQRCDGCAACVPVCPTQVLHLGDDGLAAIDFSAGECRFCGACVQACTPAALLRQVEGGADGIAGLPWQQHIAVGPACLAAGGVECRVCGECCGVGAIRFRPRIGGAALPQVQAEACNGCGACVAPCPTGAITMEVQQ